MLEQARGKLQVPTLHAEVGEEELVPVPSNHVGAQAAAPSGGGVQAGRKRGRRGADAELGLEEADAAVQLVPLGAQACDLAHDRLRPPAADDAHCRCSAHTQRSAVVVATS